MKRIAAIVGRDIRSGIRDWLIVYLSIAPFIIALILRSLIPGVGDSLLSVVVLDQNPLVSSLEQVARVELVSDLESLEQRVLRMDDVFGIVYTRGAYELVVQGNESEHSLGMLETLMARLTNPSSSVPVDIQFSDLGWEMSPLKLYGGIMLMLFTTVFGGMFIVLNLVDEKMHKTLRALNVSPLSRVELVIGKGMLGFLLPLVGCLGAAWIMGFSGIHLGMFFVTLLSIATISIIIGFSIGVMNDEPISAVASMKMVMLPVLLSVFGAMYLADNWHWVLFWSPFYWAYLNMNGILLQQADWFLVLRNSGFILGLTVLVFMGLRKKIVNGLE